MSLVSGRARPWTAPQPGRGGWGARRDLAPAASGIRGAAELRKTALRATVATGHPARGLRVPVPLVPGLASPPRPYPRPQAVRLPTGRFLTRPGLAGPHRTFWKAESERLNARDTQRDRDSITVAAAAAAAEPRAGGHRI